MANKSNAIIKVTNKNELLTTPFGPLKLGKLLNNPPLIMYCINISTRYTKPSLINISKKVEIKDFNQCEKAPSLLDFGSINDIIGIGAIACKIIILKTLFPTSKAIPNKIITNNSPTTVDIKHK